jgi:hypothetical protein
MKGYFELLKLKLSKDERKGMRRIVMKQIGRTKMKGRMGKSGTNNEGVVTIHHRPFHKITSTPCNYEFANDSRVFLF